MNRSVQLPGPAGTVEIRLTFRAFWRIEKELKLSLEALYKRVGDYAGDAGWCDVVEQLVRFAIDQPTPAPSEHPGKAREILEVAIVEIGRAGIAERLQEALERAITTDGERMPAKESGDPKAPAPAAG